MNIILYNIIVIPAKINNSIKLKPVSDVNLKNQPKNRNPMERHVIIKVIKVPLSGLIGIEILITSITPTKAVRITDIVEN